MLKYEDYVSVDFTLNSGQASTNFIRSQFDYGNRQRRAVRGYDTFSVRIVLSFLELGTFENFWDLLGDGSDKFTTDQVVNGDTSTGKIARFTAGYAQAQLSDNLFEVVVPLELIQTGV